MTCIVFVGHTKILYNQLTWTLHAQKHILDHKSIHTMNMMKGNTIKITSKYGTPVFLEVNLELYCTLVQQKKNRNGYVYNVATLFYKIKYQHITFVQMNLQTN